MSESKETRPVEEVEMDSETNKNIIRSYEDDILGGLLAAANFQNDEDEIVPIEIARNGVTLIKFRIRPLSEDEYMKCKNRYTKYIRNKQIGIKIPEDTDTTMYRSALIYQATTKDDREKVWDNKAAWKQLDVLSGVELIGKVLKAGEKDAVCDKIDEISGYSATMVETAKNS